MNNSTALSQNCFEFGAANTPLETKSGHLDRRNPEALSMEVSTVLNQYYTIRMRDFFSKNNLSKSLNEQTRWIFCLMYSNISWICFLFNYFWRFSFYMNVTYFSKTQLIKLYGSVLANDCFNFSYTFLL